ncbi:MAG: class I SAM-dependent methyltransferase, partial [Steroidobacteraceae bacterium]
DVLEMGIGSGLNLPFYSSQVRRVYGLDPSVELQRMARERALAGSLEVDFLSQSAEDVGGGEKGYQFSGREGARCGVTLWPAVGRRKREEANCFLSQAGLSSLLTSGVR